MQLLKVLLILLLVFFPFGELIRFDVGNNISLKPLDILGVLLLIWTTIIYLRNKKLRESIHWNYFLFPLIGFFSLGLNSVWLKPAEIFTSFLYLFRWVSYMSILFAIIPLGETFRKKLLYFLFADGMIVLVIGYLQFFFYPGLRNLFYLGWDDHLYRMFASFLDPNFVGAFFVLYLIFVANFLFRTGKVKRNILIINSLTIFFTVLAIFLTYSRSALLMLITSGIMFFVLLGKKKFIVYLLLTIIAFILIASPFFHVENINLFRSYSSLQRVADIKKGAVIFKDHPILGVGFNSYRYAQYKYHFEIPLKNNPVHDASGSDNSFMFVLATTGVIGFGAYCYLWFRLFKRAKERRNRYSLIFISSAVGLFVNSFFNNSLFYPEIMVWMWFITSFLYDTN